MQAAGRSRALSHTGSGTQAAFQSPLNSGPLNQQPNASSSGNPPNVSAPPSTMDQAQHQQRVLLQQTHQAVLGAMLNNRPANFLPQLAEVMAGKGTPLPPAMTGLPSPTYDPSNPRLRGILPGNSVGTFNFFGKEVDLHMLLIFVIQRGGYGKASGTGTLFIPGFTYPSISQMQTDDQQWETFLKHLGLSRLQQSPNASQPIDLVPMLKHHYIVLLQPFEQMWMKVVSQKVMMTMRQHQQQQQQQQMATQQAMTNGGMQGFNNQPQMGSMQGLGNNNPQAFGGLHNPSMQIPQQQQQPGIQPMQHGPGGLQQGQMQHIPPPMQQQLSAPNASGLPHLSSANSNSLHSQGQSFNQPESFEQQQPQLQNFNNESMDALNIPTDNLAANLQNGLQQDSIHNDDSGADLAGSDADSEARKRKREESGDMEGKRQRLDEPPMTDSPVRNPCYSRRVRD